MAGAMEKLRDYKQRIDSALSEFFDRKIKEAEKVDSSAAELMKNLKEFNLRGGKRIRPALMMHGYKCFAEPDDEQDLIRSSLAVELMEGFFLIHDDVLDQDELRRGGPTLHKVYENRYGHLKSISPKRFGESIAIVAADMQNSLANEALLLSGFDAARVNSSLRKYHEAALKTEYGWLLETMIYSRPVHKVTEEDVMKVNKYKTASYTVEGPLHMGAVLAGAGESDLKALNEFAAPLGQAFQIQDDILGMFGDEKKLGKPVGSDLKEGKITLLIVKAFEKCSEEEKNILLDALGKKGISKDEIEKVRKIITETGSLDYSRKLAEDLITRARRSLEKAELREEGKDFLIGISDFLINREY